jgi:hypothetical protein
LAQVTEYRYHAYECQAAKEKPLSTDYADNMNESV